MLILVSCFYFLNTIGAFVLFFIPTFEYSKIKTVRLMSLAPTRNNTCREHIPLTILTCKNYKVFSVNIYRCTIACCRTQSNLKSDGPYDKSGKQRVAGSQDLYYSSLNDCNKLWLSSFLYRTSPRHFANSKHRRLLTKTVYPLKSLRVEMKSENYCSNVEKKLRYLKTRKMLTSQLFTRTNVTLCLYHLVRLQLLVERNYPES